MIIPTDIVFIGEPVNAHSQIIVHTTGNPREDLQTLLERVQAGDMPGSRELCAILEEVLSLMDHRNQQKKGAAKLAGKTMINEEKRIKTNTSIFALPNGETFTYEAKTWDEILDDLLGVANAAHYVLSEGALPEAASEDQRELFRAIRDVSARAYSALTYYADKAGAKPGE